MARLVGDAEYRGAVLISDGKIADYGPNLFASGAPYGIQSVDCRGLHLAPGVVDTRVHTGEPGEEHKETLASAGAAAAVGGITSLVLLPDNEPPFDDASLIEFVARRARQVKLANMYAYGALTVGLEGKELAEMTGGRLHLAKISTAEAVAVIAAAKARGLKITCDTAAPYFALNDLAVGDYRTFGKLVPPLRAEKDRMAVVEGLKNGTIDAIVSDHRPQDQDSKRVPFAQAEPGGIGLETLLPISLELVHNGHLTLPRLFQLLSSTPARLFGLPSGKLAKGAPADLVVFDADYAWKVDRDELCSKTKNTPFDERPVQGRVMATIVGGRTIYRDDSFTPAAQAA